MAIDQQTSDLLDKQIRRMEYGDRIHRLEEYVWDQEDHHPVCPFRTVVDEYIEELEKMERV